MSEKTISVTSPANLPEPETARPGATHPLADGNAGKPLLKFAIPSIVAMLGGSLYNIVDQIFIGWSVGMLGNAATNVAFPIVTIGMSVSVLLGIGGASNFNLELGRDNSERTGKIAANAVLFSAIAGVALCFAVRLNLNSLLVLLGATNEVLPYARTYTGITLLGIPFIVMTICGNHLIRADGSPRYSMVCSLTGAMA